MNKFPKIMGIINATPDSFSDGGKFYDKNDAFAKVDEMISDGVDIIDVGGESTRPGSLPVGESEEIDRIAPVVEYIKTNYSNIIVSIDTMKFEVAKNAVELGTDIINDVSGLDFDLRLAELAAKYDKTLVLMHMLGLPRTMQDNPVYENVVEDIYARLLEKVNLAKSYGVNKVVVDPGIGFGKTIEHNVDLINNLSRFKQIGSEVLLGISRKRFIGGILKIDIPDERDFATLAIHSLTLNTKNNPDIIRVHNVKYAVQLKKLFEIFGNS